MKNAFITPMTSTKVARIRAIRNFFSSPLRTSSRTSAPMAARAMITAGITELVTDIMRNFVFCIAVVVTAIWFAANEFRRFPSTVSAIFCHICGFACGLFGVLGYGDNAMLSLGVPEFMYIKLVMLILSVVVLVLTIARFVFWLLTTLQLRKERKARLALL